MLVSVVIPVYNTEKYLERCVNSVLSQSFSRKYEIILVNDGSTDGSGALCKALADGYPEKVIALHQENAGQGQARNSGVSAACGKYLFFLDSDDWMQPETLTILTDAAEKHKADMVLFDFLSVSETGKETFHLAHMLPEGEVFSAETHPALLTASASVCDKLWRRAFWQEEKLAFVPGVWYEDFRLTVKAAPLAKRVCYVRKPLYCYLAREGSTMRNTNEARNMEILEALTDIWHFYEENGFWAQYSEELSYLSLTHGLVFPSVRILRQNPKSLRPETLRNAIAEKFPLALSGKILAQSGRKIRLLSFLLFKKQYKTVAFLLSLQKKLGR